MEKKTIIVNLFAGPGAGKSTGAAYIFSKLKMAGVDAEYVTEFAKDKVWENNQDSLHKCQFYISGKQAWRIARCYGKVDVIVTDSPILLAAMYSEDNPQLVPGIIYEYFKYRNIAYFIDRVKPYNPNGRNQTLEEAKAIDQKLIDFLEMNCVGYNTVPGNEEGYDEVVEDICRMLGMGSK